MDSYTRYAIFVVPDGALFDVASRWLGWDCVAGTALDPPVVEDLPVPAERLTKVPRRYGFHGTIKAPFALAPGTDAAQLATALSTFCAGRAPVVLPGLKVRRLGRFVALTPAAPTRALHDLAADTVRAFDRFRAPPSAAELARRRARGLTALQDAMLEQWGYPHVMEAFRFHMTLTGPTDRADDVHDALARHFAPDLPARFTVDHLALMGERADGTFHLIRRFELAG
ncbi:DUF1045 domain-containing protein [Hasllibacter sp. MH4015]|uniref:DUF1045 domain-containing protein n=1 Tax=Hasllibacter sp. MH4015 TaxID=2854029 RepID=UPI001CD64DEE|nr:DUF1045 domain-containing protein [Hasllibacter sp. MH4015]